MIGLLFNLLIFPGFVFAFFISLLFEWFIRKTEARMQNRVGPPFYQPLMDFIKLLSKETITPKKSRFLTATCILGFISVASLIPFIPMFGQKAIFGGPGDLSIILKLVALTSISFILIGIYSKSSFGFFGAIRESVLLILYEILLILSFLVIGIYSGWSFASIKEPLISTFPFLGIAFIIFTQCKIAIRPFNISEADQEIVSGYSTEFSGYRFALFYLTKIIRVFLFIALIVTIFLGGGDFFIYLIKSLIILFLITFVRAITCRIRITQAFKIGLLLLFPLIMVDLIRSILMVGLI